MRLKVTVIVATSLAVAALAWPVLRADAAGKTGRYNITLTGCVLPDGNQQAFAQADGVRDIHVDVTGVATLKCHGEIPATAPYVIPAQVLKLDGANTGAVCGTPFGTTLDWQAKVTPCGNVLLTCTIKVR